MRRAPGGEGGIRIGDPGAVDPSEKQADSQSPLDAKGGQAEAEPEAPASVHDRSQSPNFALLVAIEAHRQKGEHDTADELLAILVRKLARTPVEVPQHLRFA